MRGSRGVLVHAPAAVAGGGGSAAGDATCVAHSEQRSRGAASETAQYA
jgi:hypothetical protein